MNFSIDTRDTAVKVMASKCLAASAVPSDGNMAPRWRSLPAAFACHGTSGRAVRKRTAGSMPAARPPSSGLSPPAVGPPSRGLLRALASGKAYVRPDPLAPPPKAAA